MIKFAKYAKKIIVLTHKFMTAVHHPTVETAALSLRPTFPPCGRTIGAAVTILAMRGPGAGVATIAPVGLTVNLSCA